MCGVGVCGGVCRKPFRKSTTNIICNKASGYWRGRTTLSIPSGTHRHRPLSLPFHSRSSVVPYSISLTRSRSINFRSSLPPKSGIECVVYFAFVFCGLVVSQLLYCPHWTRRKSAMVEVRWCDVNEEM